jgi:hypothetical protein
MEINNKSSLLPEFPKLLFDQLWLNKMHDLLAKLMMYDQLFGSEINVKLLNEIAPALFYFIEKALESDIISTIGRLIDEDLRSISITKLIQEIKRQDTMTDISILDREQIRFRNEMYDLFAAYESRTPEMRRLIISRNQFVAHSAPTQPKAEKMASMNDIKMIVDFAKDILLKISQYCRDCDILFMPFNEFSEKDGQALISFVQQHIG